MLVACKHCHIVLLRASVIGLWAGTDEKSPNSAVELKIKDAEFPELHATPETWKIVYNKEMGSYLEMWERRITGGYTLNFYHLL